jgi:hypothetical protein
MRNLWGNNSHKIKESHSIQAGILCEGGEEKFSDQEDEEFSPVNCIDPCLEHDQSW